MARQWKVFDDRAELLPSPKRAEGISVFHDSIRSSPVANTSAVAYDERLSPTSNVLPKPQIINKFITHLFKSAQMEIDSLIIACLFGAFIRNRSLTNLSFR